jgi:hypothetical protein
MYLYDIMAWHCEICAKSQTYIEISNYTCFYIPAMSICMLGTLLRKQKAY